MSQEPRHWYIQKPKAHNCPLRTCGAVFQDFMPTIAEQNCEWIKVIDASAYDQLKAELEQMKAERDGMFDEINKINASNCELLCGLADTEKELNAWREECARLEAALERHAYQHAHIPDTDNSECDMCAAQKALAQYAEFKKRMDGK